MSKERELLQFILNSHAANGSKLDKFWKAKIEELLAQPEQTEQEPVAWIIETEIHGKLSEWVCTDKKHYMEEHDSIKEPIPLYLAPPKQPESTAEAVMPNGVCVSNVYDAYEEGRKSVMVEQEPVAWKVIDGTNGKYMFSRIKPTERSYKYDVVIPLYTAPPKREPLSDEEVFDIGYKAGFAIDQDESDDYESEAYGFINGDGYVDNEPFFKLVRAIEKAHGIGGGK
jgi:hypothetical protein